MPRGAGLPVASRPLSRSILAPLLVHPGLSPVLPVLSLAFPAPSVIPAKPVPDICYRGAGIQGFFFSATWTGVGRVGCQTGWGFAPFFWIPAKGCGNDSGAAGMTVGVGETEPALVNAGSEGCRRVLNVSEVTEQMRLLIIRLHEH